MDTGKRSCQSCVFIWNKVLY